MAENYSVSATCTINGKAYPISKIQVVVQENSIPLVYLSVAPGTSGKSTEVISTGLTALSSWNAALQQASSDRAAASVSVTVTPTTGGGTAQSLSLTGWRTVSAGIPEAGASGTFSTEVVIAHPASVADCGALITSFVPMPGSDIPEMMPVTLSSDTVISTLSKYLSLYGSAPEIQTGVLSGGSGLYANLKKQATTLSAALNQYFVWGDPINGGEPPHWPLMQVDTGIVDVMGRLLAGVASENAGSLVQVLAQRLGPEFGFSMLPTYDKEKLYLRPFDPWGSPNFSIPASYINTLQFPAEDPNPVMGALSVMTTPAAANDSSYLNSMGVSAENNILDRISGYIPAAVDTGSAFRMNGSLLTVSLPGWVQSLPQLIFAASAECPVGEDNPSLTEQDIDTDYLTDVSSLDAEANATLLQTAGALYSQFVFMTTYLQGVDCMVRTKLCMDISGGTKVIPGHVANILDEAGGSIFHFYVTSVVHVIDVLGSTAYSEFTGQYARPAGGIKGMISEGDKNPLYYGSGMPTFNQVE